VDELSAADEILSFAYVFRPPYDEAVQLCRRGNPTFQSVEDIIVIALCRKSKEEDR